MSNIQTQSWLIDRRHALRAMGTCISLPMLECMIPLNAAEQQSAAPRRSAFIYLDVDPPIGVAWDRGFVADFPEFTVSQLRQGGLSCQARQPRLS
ncbi:MAG: hypothetical protein ACI8P0_002986, partial [Planctomycetaceae bacterium]